MIALDRVRSHQEEVEEEEALLDAFEVMTPEEVEFLSELKENQPGSHFHEVCGRVLWVCIQSEEFYSFHCEIWLAGDGGSCKSFCARS